MKRHLVRTGSTAIALWVAVTLVGGCAKPSALKKEAVVTREAPAEAGISDQAALAEREARERALREEAAREQRLREQSLREQVIRDQPLRERAQQEQAARDAAARATREAAEKARRDATTPIPKELLIPDIYFEFDRFHLSPEAQRILRESAPAFQRHREYRLVVEGHADQRGTIEYNLALGEKRASEVMKYLVGLGIEKERIRTISYGKEKPQDPGESESAWAKNRRVHFVVEPPGR